MESMKYLVAFVLILGGIGIAAYCHMGGNLELTAVLMVSVGWSIFAYDPR